MRNINLVAFMLLSVPRFLVMASDGHGTKTEAGTVLIKLDNGKSLECEFEFYRDGWTATFDEPGSGLTANYMACYRKLAGAKNLDEWLATATERSVKDMPPQRRAMLEKLKFDRPASSGATRFFLSVKFQDDSGEHIFFCLHPTSPDAQFSDGYVVSAMTKERGEWKMDYTMSSHPLFKRILSRNLSDFGGPNLPKERADEMRSESSTTRPSTTQPATTQPRQ